jgi:hypothetical protein
VEFFQVGESAGSWLDGGACLVEELADVAEALVDGLGPDAEQGRDGDLGQAQAVVEDGGQEPAGEGEDGPSAGPLADFDAGPVAAALVQVRCPWLVPGGKWQTVVSSPVSTAKAASSAFQARVR